MPTPTQLAAILQNAGAFDPSRQHKLYQTNKPLWQLYLDLTELDQNKLKNLVEKHADDEDAAKYKLRQALAAAYNLIPSILGIIRLYLFTEEPAFDVGTDPDLKAFIDNCDGNGMSWKEYVRQTALPMTLAMGWLDVLVQNPLTDGSIQTEADAKAAEVHPRVIKVLPLQRLNWACQPNDAYNWVTFEDVANESVNPLLGEQPQDPVYITLVAKGGLPNITGDGINSSVWIRSVNKGGSFTHEADFSPTARVPIATVYFQKSNDPKQRHFGVSKIAMMAVLTKLIIQLLSWTMEDVLANLALMAIPTKNGQAPKAEDGSPAVTALGVFSTIYYSMEAKNPPEVIQGETTHIDVKLKIIEQCIREILRLAHLIGIAGEQAGHEKSGFHAVVNRNELFNELKELAASFDTFTLDTLALVKSWASGEDWSRERLVEEGKVSSRFYKGPYTTEAVEQVLKDATAAIQMFRDISPTLCVNQAKETARAVLYQDDPDLPTVMKEIETNTGKVLAADSAGALLAEAAAISDGAAMSNTAIEDAAKQKADAAKTAAAVASSSASSSAPA